MCLTLTSNWKENTKYYQSLDKPFVAWKIFRVKDMISRHCTVNSIFRSYKWKNGVNVSNRENKKITDLEIRYRRINKGIHSFAHYNDAKDYMGYMGKMRGYIVLPVKIFPKNVVAIGRYGSRSCIVSHKVTIRFNQRRITKILTPHSLRSKNNYNRYYCKEIVNKWNLIW